MDAKTLNKRIDALGKKTEHWRDEVQLVLVDCAARAFDDAHNDVDGFSRLVRKVVGSDMTTLIKWIETFTPAKWNPKKESPYGEGAFTLNKKFVGEFNGLKLAGEAWWAKAKRPEQVRSTVFNVDEAVAEFIKKMTYAAEHGKVVAGSGPIAETLAKAAGVKLVDLKDQAEAIAEGANE